LRIFSCALATLLCLGRVQAQQAAPPAANLPHDPVVLTVGERRIPASELCLAIQSLPPPQRKGYALHPNMAAQWFGPLVAMAEEAKREHLGAPVNQKLSEVDRDNALVGELIQVIAQKAQATDSEIANYYAEHKNDFEQIKARHILISDAAALASRSRRSAAEAQTKADGIASELKRGADFAAMAAKESDDPYTNNKGGDLGYVSHRQLEPALDEKIWSLPIGEVSAAFEGRFGYEIVQVEARRMPLLEEVRESIIGRIKAAALQQRQQEIVAAAHVALQPDFADSPLPCETALPPFTLKDSLQAP
jgi:parvulin-like peptidyl-prolyl cis-trans isomerase-like protein